jgi:hypothetical protein
MFDCRGCRNPNEGMDVCLLCLFCVVKLATSAMSWLVVQRSPNGCVRLIVCVLESWKRGSLGLSWAVIHLFCHVKWLVTFVRIWCGCPFTFAAMQVEFPVIMTQLKTERISLTVLVMFILYYTGTGNCDSPVGVKTSVGVEWWGRDADHSPPASAKVKNEWIYTPASLICLSCMHRDNFTFF